GLLGHRWIHVRGSSGRDVLKNAIEHAGGTYTVATAYETRRPTPLPSVLRSLQPQTERGEGFDAICFASGQTFEHCLQTLSEAWGPATAREALRGAAIVSIGPVTTRAITQAGFTVTRTAQTPDDEGLVNALREVFAIE